MLKITRQEVDALRENKMGKFITIINKTHGSKAKTYYVVEDQRVRRFLQQFNEKRMVEGKSYASA